MQRFPLKLMAAGLVAVCAVAGAALAQGHASHAGHAGAHEMTITASIPDGETFATAPARVTLMFSPPMRLVRATLTTAAGEVIPVVFDPQAIKAASAQVELPKLTPDRYTLRYSVDAGDHMMSGQVRFSVQTARKP